MSKADEEFDLASYQRRLRLLREIISGERQSDFARRLGIPPKRWNNYERGYPVSREVAFRIHKAFPGMSIEWIWFGAEGNLSDYYREKIRTAELLDKQTEADRKAFEKAKSKFEETIAERKKALGETPPEKNKKRRKSRLAARQQTERVQLKA